MKTQKEALALKLKIDELRKLQEETARKAREAEMRREGIPLNRDEEVRLTTSLTLGDLISAIIRHPFLTSFSILRERISHFFLRIMNTHSLAS